MQSLSTNVKTTRVSNAVAAGITLVTSSIIDTKGFDVTRFEALLGAITAGGTVRVQAQHGDVANLSDAADLSGVVDLTDTDDNKVAIVEIVRPAKRYLRLKIIRSTQNTVVDGIIALQYGARNVPTVDDATTVKTRVITATPDEDH